VRKDVLPGCQVVEDQVGVISIMDKDTVKCFQRTGGRECFGASNTQSSFCGRG